MGQNEKRIFQYGYTIWYTDRVCVLKVQLEIYVNILKMKYYKLCYVNDTIQNSRQGMGGFYVHQKKFVCSRCFERAGS
jgi:hypothetical protein